MIPLAPANSLAADRIELVDPPDASQDPRLRAIQEPVQRGATGRPGPVSATGPLGLGYQVIQPHGATCMLVLAESQLVVSTWPEHQLAHIDLFTCRADTDPEHAIAPILTALHAGTVHDQRIHRSGPRNSTSETTPASTGTGDGGTQRGSVCDQRA